MRTLKEYVREYWGIGVGIALAGTIGYYCVFNPKVQAVYEESSLLEKKVEENPSQSGRSKRVPEEDMRKDN